MNQKMKDNIFEVLFWAAMGLGALLIVAVVTLSVLVYKDPERLGEVDPGVALATGALALFTAFLWLAAAITARFARAELSISTAVNSANLTLQIDNRFQSDRALRIRHGAAQFLANERGVVFNCDHDISPYGTAEYQHPWHGLSSDLIDLFHYYDWIGYLTSEESKAIDREVVWRKLGPWIIKHYQMCEERINEVQKHQPHRWPYLRPFYKDMMDRTDKWYEQQKMEPPMEDAEEEFAAFLQREHVRSHRGFHPPKEISLQQD